VSSTASGPGEGKQSEAVQLNQKKKSISLFPRFITAAWLALGLRHGFHGMDEEAN